MKKILANNVHVSELYIGRVVEDSPIFSEYTDIGHIMGFDRNHVNELLLVVKFSKRNEPSTVHPCLVNVWVED